MINVVTIRYNPIPAVEPGASFTPMHYLFEIQLITKEIVGKATAENRAEYAWMVKSQHVRRYLVNYYREYGVLPTGRRYLGMTRPLNLDMGMVDLGAIRQKIRADSEKWNGMHVDRPKDSEGLPGYSPHSEIMARARAQATGREPGKVIFDLRETRTRRGKKA